MIAVARMTLESKFFAEPHRLFGVLLSSRTIATHQVMPGQIAGGLSQHVRGWRPLSHLPHFARYRPGTIGVAESEQAKVQAAERTYPAGFQFCRKRLLRVECGKGLLQMFVRSDQLAEF